MLIPYLDLFSGIGGFALALKSIAKPVAYCEIDPDCQRLLQRKMQQGVLPPAKVISDIRLLKSTDLRIMPRLICAGFPCQDVSCQNSEGRGIDGVRSGLVMEVVRLARDMPSVTHIFMENSPMIQIRGLPQLQAAFTQLGFRLRWTIIGARDCGAPHERKRWWCIASRRDLTTCRITLGRNPWCSGKEPCPRLVPRKADPIRAHDRKMIQLLGSAVVPRVVQLAWNCLMVPGFRPPQIAASCTPLKLVQGSTVFQKSTWATPLHNSGSSLTQNNVLTYRASKALSNQIFYDVNTPKPGFTGGRKISDVMDINVCFIEYLMGYPPHYMSV